MNRMLRVLMLVVSLLGLWSRVEGHSFPETPGARLEGKIVVYSPDGRLLAAAHRETILLYATQTLVAKGLLEGHTRSVSSLAFSPDSRLLASGGTDNTIRLWDVIAQQEIAVLKGHTSPVNAVAWSPDGRFLASGGTDFTIRLWDVIERREIAILGRHGDRVTAVAWSPDGRFLASGGEDTYVRLWDMGKRRQDTVFVTGSVVFSVAFNPNGQILAAGGDGGINLWDVVQRRSTVSISLYRRLVTALAFSPDDEFLAWGGDDGGVHLWDVVKRQEVAVLTGRTSGGVNSLSFSPDGQTLASGGGGGVLLYGGVPSRGSPDDQSGDIGQPAGAKLIVEVEKTAILPTLDGELGDWPNVRWIPFAQGDPHISTEPVYELRDDGATEVSGVAGTPADLSGSFALQWDEDGIYLAARVTDNVHDVTGETPEKWWLKDSVSLFLDIPLDGDGARWITGDHAFSFVTDPTYPDGGVWWRHGDPRGHQEVPAPPEVRVAVQLNESWYTLEAAIPMTVLTSLTPDWRPPFEERSVGFMFIVTDPDGGPDPFGGELIYGGDNDNDAQWARLRFVSAGTATSPHFEVPIPDDPAHRMADPRIVEIIKKLTMPPGFRATLFATVPNGPNRMRLGPDGRLYVTVGGWGPGHKVWTLEDADGDGIAEKRKVFIDGLDTPLGMAFRGTDLYVTHRTGGTGRVSLYRDTDGDDRGEWIGDIVKGLSQGHGVGNIVLGPDDRLYIGQGSTGDLRAGPSPVDATIFRVDPDGQNLQIVAKGLRNPYGFAFDRQGRLFATDNGPNHLDAPHHDELNHIVEGRDYGFPRVYLNPDETAGITPPIWRFAEHASANGMTFYTGSAFPSDYRDNAFVALWGPADPEHVDLVTEPRPPWDAYYVVRVELADTEVTRVSSFAGDFQHPNDVTVGRNGELFVADWGSTGPNGSQAQADGDGAIYRIVYDGGPTVTHVVEGEVQRVLPEGVNLTGIPNPFNATTVLSYTVPEDGRVVLRVYDIRGQVVRTLIQGWIPGGYHHTVWNGRDDKGRQVGSGLYLVRLTSDSGITRTLKLLLVR